MAKKKKKSDEDRLLEELGIPPEPEPAPEDEVAVWDERQPSELTLEDVYRWLV